MARIIVWLASTIASLVLVFGYHTSTAGPTSTVAVGTSEPGGEVSTADPTPQTTDTSTSETSGATRAATTYTGDTVSTRYGPVQVQITVDGTTVTDVAVLQVPSGGESSQINDAAVPQLDAEVVDGDPTDVHTVSGASYTSEAYIDSLQSALDQANL